MNEKNGLCYILKLLMPTKIPFSQLSIVSIVDTVPFCDIMNC